MPFVIVKLIKGAFSKGEKQALIREITEAFVKVTGNEKEREAIRIVIEEVEEGHWGSGGRVLDLKALKERGYHVAQSLE